MPRRRTVLATAAIAVAILGAGAEAAPSAVADPSTVARFADRASATRYAGPAFDACTAPPLSTMIAWGASPYRALGVYVGGPNRSCTQANLTADWVGSVSRRGWKLLPVYMGRQAPCSSRVKAVKITPSKYLSQGKASAGDAVAALSALGMQPGSVVYADMENYSPSDAMCRDVVLGYLSAFTRELHRRGYLSGIYVNLSSGARHLATAYGSTSYARPDAVWIARWDGSPSLSGLAGVPDQAWSTHQRIKQYLGDHNETYGGRRINIDTNWVNAPVATVSQPYQVEDNAIARTGPAVSSTAVATLPPGAPVQVTCQAPGPTTAGGSTGWDKLPDGSYVSEKYLSPLVLTGYRVSLPRCYYPYQVSAPGGLSRRAGTGAGTAKHGTLPSGALVWVVCQRGGDQVGTSKIWDKIDTGYYVSDYFVSTPSQTTFSAPIPRC